MTQQAENTHPLFKIQYQPVGEKRKYTLDYTAPNVRELLKVLDRAEKINTGNTEFLVIHQINTDGTVFEVMDHDKKSNVTYFNAEASRSKGGKRVFRPGEIVDAVNEARRERRLQKAAERENKVSFEEYLKRWTSKQEDVLNAVTEAISEARSKMVVEVLADSAKHKPRVKLKHGKPPYTLGGFFYMGFQADETEAREPSKQESNKFGADVNA